MDYLAGQPSARALSHLTLVLPQIPLALSPAISSTCHAHMLTQRLCGTRGMGCREKGRTQQIKRLEGRDASHRFDPSQREF
jgi:hypothetical protein